MHLKSPLLANNPSNYRKMHRLQSADITGQNDLSIIFILTPAMVTCHIKTTVYKHGQID